LASAPGREENSFLHWGNNLKCWRSNPRKDEISTLEPADLARSIAADFFNAIGLFRTLARCLEPDIQTSIPIEVPACG
jgi:hypothetical protein